LLGVLWTISSLAVANSAGQPAAAAVAPFPQGVTGSVVVNGSPAPDTVTITVQVGGEPCPTNPATVHPADGTYFLAIVYQSSGPCSSTGPALFFVDGQQASEPVTFTLNPQTGVNLSAKDTFDVDCDHVHGVTDVLAILHVLAGVQTLPQPQVPCDADVDDDQDIDPSDALAALRKLAALPTP
jgi:hypothetical protein